MTRLVFLLLPLATGLTAFAGLEAAHFQSQIDAVSAAGGGRVIVPAGRHLVGQLDLRDNVELHLEKGAVLEGASGMENYRVTELPYSEGTWSAVVSAIGVTNVAITGPGEIYGNGTAWPQPENFGGNQEGLRPRGVFFADCKGIRLSDFKLRDAACWGIVFKCCDGVDVRRLTIDNHANVNNDGIDVEAKNVVIADCDIDSADDAVCLKSNTPDFVVENVLVSNVTARSHCNALKLGTASHGSMRNVLFVDCRTEAPRRDFVDRRFGRNRRFYEEDPDRLARHAGVVPGEVSCGSALAVENVDGGTVENVTYRNITANGSRAPIFVRAGTRSGRSCGTPPSDKRVFRNIVFENVTGEAMSFVASSVTGVPGCRISGVTLRNVRIVCRGGGETETERTRPVPEAAGGYPDSHMFCCMLPAYGLYARHVDGLALENVAFTLKPGTTDRREAIVLDDVGAPFVTVLEQLPRDRRPDTVRRERCDTLVVAKAIVNPKPVAKAVWRTTALGVYETYVNGVADCAQAMKPGYTNAARRRQEMTWTIGEGLKRGEGETNVFAARVTCGWWRDRVIDWHGGSFDDTAFRGSLTLTYADGTTETFLTDPTWKAAYAGQVVHADIYYGETVDARISEAFLADPQVLAAWTNAVVCDSFKGEITPLAGAGVCRREDLALKPVGAYAWKGADGAEGTNVFGRVRRVRTFQPGETLVVEPGETLVVDFGQNASATPDFAFSAAEGTRLTVNFAEMLNDANGERSRGNDGPAGSAYLASMRSCPSQFDYVFAGRGVERCRPSFSFWGYRYLTARATGRVEIRSLRSVPVTSVTREMERGTLVTGDAAVNRLLSNVRWGMLSNYLSVPTDCPQRDERQGWAADTQVFTRTGLYLADVYPFFMKWMRDVTDTQRPNGLVRSVAPGLPPKAGETKPETQHIGWADAIVIVPWTNWRMSGDPAIVKANWEPMTRFVDLVASSRYATPEGAWQHADWLSYEKVKGEYGDFCEWWKFLGSCYICLDARMMAEMADVAAPSERARFERMAAEALGYLRANFLTADGDIRETFCGLQTAHLFALKVGLAPTDAAKRRIRDRLLALIRRNGDRLSTGFLGTSVLMDTLSEEAAAPEVAYTLLLQHENPSWLYSVDQGATTIWERWNGYTREKGFGPVSMNSFNHYAYGAVAAWLYGTAAGIRPGPRGGFDEFVLAPVPDARLGSVDASFRTPKGTIRSCWKYENGVCRWSYTVPEGATALVRMNGREERRTSGTYDQELVGR